MEKFCYIYFIENETENHFIQKYYSKNISICFLKKIILNEIFENNKKTKS